MKTNQNALRITLLQTAPVWEDKEANYKLAAEWIAGEAEKGTLEIVLLPELWATGFSMDTEKLGETMEGETVSWMRDTAKKHRCIVGGSVIIKEEEKYFNRFVWMQPNGEHHHYDKRHLFAFGEEDEHFSAGNRRVIVQAKGWKICLQVCYDLRFPVWSRNAGGEYDLLIYVASWPERRAIAWDTLLPARAIENQAYLVGLNRTGEDGHGVVHAGGSTVYDAEGKTVWAAGALPRVHTVVLDKETLLHTRSHYPFLSDADSFLLR
jgi:predicted amidohydrolase